VVQQSIVAHAAHHTVKLAKPAHAVRHHRTTPLLLTAAQVKQLFKRPWPQRVSPTRAIPFVPAQGVTLVPPTAVPVAGGVDWAPSRSSTPPKAPPKWPSTPNAPANDSPISFGGALSGPAGGAIMLFAALASVLMIIVPWLTSRVAMSVDAPIEWRRRLSLERPG
jgi:hypothetical protein